MSQHSLPLPGLLMVVLWTVGLGSLYVGAQDLSDLPGPGGTLLIRDIATGRFSLGFSSRLGALLLPFVGSPVWVARVLSIGATVAAAVGATLLGTAVAGRTAGTWAGLLTAAWAPAAYIGWSLGPGTIAWGVTWLGLGLCAWACRQQRLVWVLVGATVALCGTAVKSTALPALVLLPLMPLWAATGWRGRVRMSAIVAVGAGLGIWIGLLGATTGEPFLLAPDSPSLARILPAAHGFSALEGIEGVFSIVRRGHPHGSFGVAVGLAIIGVLVPGDHRLVRTGILLLTLAAMAIVGLVTGPLLVPRYLVPASLGLVVLSGIALRSWPRDLVPRNIWRGLAGIVLLVVTMDGIAFASAWSRVRQTYIAIEGHRFPPVPAPFAARYTRLGRGIVKASSQPGILGLMKWIRAQPGEPFASTPFRDRRESHAHLAAIASGSPFSVLRQGSCCSDSPDIESCAFDLVRTIQDGGVRLMMPDGLEGTSPDEQRFAEALGRAAGELQLQHHPIDGFSIWVGQGSGGADLCRPGQW